jgi:hypothetical protein
MLSEGKGDRFGQGWCHFLCFSTSGVWVFSHRSSPHLASDWNTIWEIFHSPETSSLLMRLADQFCVQDLRSERGLMPIHDVGFVQEDTRSSLPLCCLSSSCFSVCDLGTLGWVGFHGTLAFLLFLNRIRLSGMVASRTNRRNDARAKEVARQEDMGFSPNSTSNDRQDTARRFNSPHLNILPLDNHGLCFFSCSVCLSWTSFWTGTGDDISAFSVFPWRLETYKAGVGTTHHSD